MSRNDYKQALLDYIVIDRRAKEIVMDENVLKRTASGVSDHYLVKVRVKNYRILWERGNNMDEKWVMKVSELGKLLR